MDITCLNRVPSRESMYEGVSAKKYQLHIFLFLEKIELRSHSFFSKHRREMFYGIILNRIKQKFFCLGIMISTASMLQNLFKLTCYFLCIPKKVPAGPIMKELTKYFSVQRGTKSNDVQLLDLVARGISVNNTEIES